MLKFHLMKVACSACGATYTIADKKISGRRVRVRCKGCKSPIIVDGVGVGAAQQQAPSPADQAAAAIGAEGDDEPTNYADDQPPPWAKGSLAAARADEEATRLLGKRAAMRSGAAISEGDDGETHVLGKDEMNDVPAWIEPLKPEPTLRDATTPDQQGEWQVSVDDGDTRQMDVDDVVDAYRARVVDNETFVWKEGMADWQCLGEVPELREATRAAQPSVSAPRSLGGPRPPPAQRDENARTRGGRDLFESIPDPDDPSPPRKGARGGSAKRKGSGTGARSENSVLFSLNALKAGAEPSAEKAKPQPAPKPDDSPEDILGLSAPSPLFATPATDDVLGAPPISPDPAPEPAPTPAPAPDPPPVAPAASVPPVSAATPDPRGSITGMAAVPDEPARKSPLIWIGAITIVVLLVGGGLFVGLRVVRGGAPEDAVARSSDSTQASAPAAATAATPDPEPAASTAPTTDEPAPKAEEAPRSTAPEAPSRAREDEAKKPRDVAEAKSPSADDKEEKDEPEAPEPKEAPEPEETPEEPEEPEEPEGDGDEAPEAPPEETERPPFDKGAARAALSSAAASVAGCKRPGGPTGRGRATVTFAPSGRVTTANVSGGEYGGSAVGGCIAGIFRRARVPAFSGSPVTVAKSFNIN